MITDYLGTSPRIKVIELLIDNRDKGLSIREIILGANVKHRNLVEIIKDLLEKDVIYIERKIGKSNLYKINEFNDMVQGLIFSKEISKKWKN